MPRRIDARRATTGHLALLPLACSLTLAGCHRSAPSPERPVLAAVSQSIVRPEPPRADPCCSPEKPPGPPLEDPGELATVPDVALVDEDGKPVRFHSDLLSGRTFALNFAFTRCEGVCPVLGANFGQLRRLLDERGEGGDVILITVSVDPRRDTPGDLKAWGLKHGSGPGWKLVTGSPAEVERLLVALRVNAPTLNRHTQSVLVGDGRSFRAEGPSFAGRIRRVGGLANPKEMAEVIRQVSSEARSRAAAPADPPPSSAARPSPAEAYFTTWADPSTGEMVRRDVTLVDQDGKSVRFYADVLKDRNVAIHAFFTKCGGACPKMFGTMNKLQSRLGDRVGRDVSLVSISVDPAVDTPGRLREYAQQLNARPGWSFLTGRPEDVEAVVKKLHPQFVARDTHSTCFFLGNLRTHTWAKPDIASNADEKIAEAAFRMWDEKP